MQQKGEIIAIVYDELIVIFKNKGDRDFPSDPVARTLCSQGKGPGLGPRSGD